MKYFRGRAILADEVGLGKTIEAGLILKEYLMRGLVRTALVLAPSSLVRQWQEELAGKFGIPFISTQDDLFKTDPDRFWAEPFILASLQTARSKRHFPAATSRSYDLVVVDEAHHLKNRATQNWKLVNAIQKTFLLMLTATPVQNHLEELYNLVTLLKPGHLKTQKAFKAEFVTRGNPTDPRNREKLRQLLKEVMVRNTRSVTQLRLPPRFVQTVRLSPTSKETAFYQAVSRFVTTQASHADTPGSAKMTWRKLLEAAGSSPAAAMRMLERLAERPHDGLGPRLNDLLALGRQIRLSAKVRQVVELIQATPAQKIIFVNHLASLEYLEQMLAEQQIPHAVYQGGLTPAQKQAALTAFRDGCPVLLATGTGGEGHNLQFCQVMLNYDLPWNPMEIEQRIGRLHRIGQEKEVQVYNFCAAGSIEDHILEVLDRKINMFELVVGEIDMILGRLQGEEEFSDLVYDLWVQHPDEAQRQRAFEALAARLQRARGEYEKSKELDDKLFQEDFGV
jgi:SNF2 family DNA or RNA helicase